jgi:hypothetical protein
MTKNLRSGLSGILLVVGVLLAAGLGACSGPSGNRGPLELTLARKGVCRVGPDGGAPHVRVAARDRQADRGIGGTGAIAAAKPDLQTADRGIGGTGIVGVVTGFASICVDGVEVAYDSFVGVDVDGAAADISQLRAGEVVAIRAVVSEGQPKAERVSVRIEAAGRIERVARGKREWQVAGQQVLVGPSVPGASRFGPGDWVSVSGLRRPDGVIVASRLDRASTHTMSVRGVVREEAGALHLGTLLLPVGSARQGDWVHVVGAYSGKWPHARSVSADDLCPNPFRCFQGSVEHIVLQGFVRFDGRTMWVNGLEIPAGEGVGQQAFEGVRVVSLERQRDGHYAAVAMRMPDPVRSPGMRKPLPLPPDVPVPAEQPASPDATDDPAVEGSGDIPLADGGFQANPPSIAATIPEAGEPAVEAQQISAAQPAAGGVGSRAVPDDSARPAASDTSGSPVRVAFGIKASMRAR